MKHPPDKSFGHMIRDVNRRLQKDLGQRLRLRGLSIGQWYALRVLWLEDGLTQAEIAQRAGIAAPGMMAVIRGLEADGIVTRDPHPTDQRKNVVLLTKKGRALERPCLADAIVVNKVALEGVTAEELATCMRVLHAARSNMNADEEKTGAGRRGAGQDSLTEAEA